MIDLIGKPVLITTADWFYGHDGKLYKAAHGILKGIHEASKTLGVVPNRANANWHIEIGDMFIAGCQVLYAIHCPAVNPDQVTYTEENDSKTRDSHIYIMKP